MSHKRVKNVDFDDEDLEDYEEGDAADQLSPEDQEQMRQGIQAIKAALSKDYDLDDAFISETLYYYYFDADKSIDYIRSKRKPRAQKQVPPQPKPAGVSEQKAPKGKTVPAATKSKDTDGITQGVQAVKIETQKVKSKNLDVPAEYAKLAATSKNEANFVVVGHVDHGKSTLMGRLLYDLGHIDHRAHEKTQKMATENKKGSFALAWAMDSTEEERARGVTVDIATNTFETEKTVMTILDAPGHKDFIPNMIAGASQADFAVLVVDASVNAFEAGLKGQTREHAQLVRSIGISRVVVAVNKMDAAGWSEERYNTIKTGISHILNPMGFAPDAVVFVPCAGLTGENVALPLDPWPAWYDGGTLVDALDASEPAARRVADPLRLTVSDVQRTAAPGVSADVSVTGRLDAGSVQVGDVLLAQPAGAPATVKTVDVDGDRRDWAAAGQIATLGLVGVDGAALRAGDVLCARGADEVRCARAFTARCVAFAHVVPGAVVVYRGRLSGAAQVAQLLELQGADGAPVLTESGKRRRPRVVKPGQVVRLRVVFEGDVALPLEAPDRVVLRSEGTTLAAGLLDGIEEAV